MYRSKNSYGECQLLALNTMGIRQTGAVRFSGAELLCVIAPVVIIAAALLWPELSNFTFLAQCQNIPGGDVCSISLQ